eukprot:339704_1
MLTFDLKTKHKVASKTQSYKTFLFIVENKLHQICSQNGDHYVCNKTNEFNKITTCQSFDGLSSYCLIHLKSQQSVLLFGGVKPRGVQFIDWSDSIYRFSCMDSQWKELNIKMPIKLSLFGLVATKNEQYIIILGGLTTAHKSSDDIFIYDIRNNIFTKSKIKCPKKERY